MIGILRLALFGFLLFSAVIFGNCSDKDDGKGTSMKAEINEILSSTKLVGFENVFPNNESLNQPLHLRYNSKNNEILVLDIGNVAIYVFSDSGKFKKKIGRPGQGPGELLQPTFFELDEEGNIFVLEAGNQRISIFSESGDFINSFRLPNHFDSWLTRIFANKKRDEIVVNLVFNDHYLTVFSYDGAVTNKIGKITVFDEERPDINMRYAQGPFFINEQGKYVVFIDVLGIIKIFDKNGDLLDELQMAEIFTNEKFLENLKSPYNQKKGKITVTNLFEDIQYSNNEYFLFSGPIKNKETKKIELTVSKLNGNFALGDITVLMLPTKNINRFLFFYFGLVGSNRFLQSSQSPPELYLYEK